MLRDEQGNAVSSDEQRANMLNKYFSSVCTEDNGTSPSIVRAVPDEVFIDNIAFTPFKVAMAIKRLKAGKSSGPDGYPPFLFKKLAPSLAEPLSLVYSAFMSVGHIPNAWTRAIVTPVFKRGDAADVGNYRPISLTSVACKIMERVISTDVLHYLRTQNIISKHQHGFLSGRSTNTNLHETLNEWT